MIKSVFIKELVKRVETNATELLEDVDDYLDGDSDFNEWLHFITDGGIEGLFYEI